MLRTAGKYLTGLKISVQLIRQNTSARPHKHAVNNVGGLCVCVRAYVRVCRLCSNGLACHTTPSAKAVYTAAFSRGWRLVRSCSDVVHLVL
jgi:hypothetical protein